MRPETAPVAMRVVDDPDQTRRSVLWCVWAPVLTGTIALCVYSLTVAGDLSWAHFSSDGGELITAAVTLGVPHPPGYPTYILLGKVMSYLPLGNVALRFNLLSALCTAVATAFVSATALHYPRRDDLPLSPIVAMSVGLTFAFAPLVWGQALITEVYALNLAVLAALLWALLAQRSPWLVGLLWGLSLTTHLTSALMLPLVLLVRPIKEWPALFGGACIGVLPFLLLPFLALGDSPVIWGDPTTFSGWWWLVSGALYRPNLISLPIDALSSRLPLAMVGLLRQFAFVGWLLLPIAFTRRNRTPVAWLLLGTGALYAVYTIIYNSIDYVLFFLPGMLIAAILLTPGMRKLTVWSLLLPLLLLALHFGSFSERTDDVRGAVQTFMDSAPQDALLVTTGDENIFSLWYFQHVEGWRPDLVVVDANLLGFDWYRNRLAKQYPTVVGLERYDVAAFQAANAERRVVCRGSLHAVGQMDCSEVAR
ncbi:MAG: DUF2723 domain-containing protein [Anaerolineae bacterium]|nr:DUF2723 domain-containing protein [Anaerolineae bacterium]